MLNVATAGVPNLTGSSTCSLILPAAARTADSVVDSNAAHIENKTANGFVMVEASADGLYACILRALEMFRHHKQTWLQIQKTGMSQNLSWDKSAQEYFSLYKTLGH